MSLVELSSLFWLALTFQWEFNFSVPLCAELDAMVRKLTSLICFDIFQSKWYRNALIGVPKIVFAIKAFRYHFDWKMSKQIRHHVEAFDATLHRLCTVLQMSAKLFAIELVHFTISCSNSTWATRPFIIWLNYSCLGCSVSWRKTKPSIIWPCHSFISYAILQPIIRPAFYLLTYLISLYFWWWRPPIGVIPCRISAALDIKACRIPAALDVKTSRISAALDVKASSISAALDVKACRISAVLDAKACRISALYSSWYQRTLGPSSFAEFLQHLTSYLAEFLQHWDATPCRISAALDVKPCRISALYSSWYHVKWKWKKPRKHIMG